MKFGYSVDSYMSYTCSFIYRNNLATTYCNIFLKNLFLALFLGKKENQPFTCIMIIEICFLEILKFLF